MSVTNHREFFNRIAPELGKMGGKPLIRGRRITPSMVLTMLANGASQQAVLEGYPALEPADVDACLLYAARLSDLAATEGTTIAADAALLAEAVAERRMFVTKDHDIGALVHRDLHPYSGVRPRG